MDGESGKRYLDLNHLYFVCRARDYARERNENKVFAIASCYQVFPISSKASGPGPFLANVNFLIRVGWLKLAESRDDHFMAQAIYV